LITGIDHLVLTVRDNPAAAAFYRRVLLARVETFAGGRTALHFGNQKINLHNLGQETRNHAGIGAGDVCLVTDWPAARVIAHLTEQHVDILEGPVQKSGALGPIASVYFNDPDGNLIEVATYKKETP
jgi:catechol 2,3-dioxygenase-like lactoylglutathione lyase family enzyme